MRFKIKSVQKRRKVKGKAFIGSAWLRMIPVRGSEETVITFEDGRVQPFDRSLPIEFRHDGMYVWLPEG